MTQVAFITGSAGDIGRAIAITFAEQGYHVVCADINDALNQKTMTALSDMGAGATAITVDLTDEKQVQEAAQQTGAIGDVNVIINNAALCSSLNQRNADYQQWRLEQDISLNTMFLVIKAFEDKIIGGQVGAIVNTASVNGLGTYGNTAYSVAKAGMIHYTRQLAVEFGKYGCRVNCVAPGTVRTQAWDARVQKNPDVWDEVTQWYALGRVAMPQDVANAIWFLASENASAITGITMPVDCGMTAGVKKMADSFAQDDF